MLHHRRSILKGWWIVLPTAAILLAAVVLTGTSQAAPATDQAPTVPTKLLFQEQQPLCKDCHPEQYAAWKGTAHANAVMDPVFQGELSKSKDQTACLACHTTGFDTGTGQFMAEGVTCEACHGAYKEGHPKAETMQLPMESTTCRLCHQATFDNWETSAHGQKGVQCYSCHLPHSQSLRTGSEETLCAGCHQDRQTQFAHATHGINGLQCKTCHMADEMHNHGAAATTGIEVANHSFKVGSDVCAGCHQDTIHSSAKLPTLREAAAVQDPAQLKMQAAEVPALKEQVNKLQDSLVQQRKVSIMVMGLMLGGGGAVGLLLGVAAVALLKGKAKS